MGKIEMYLYDLLYLDGLLRHFEKPTYTIHSLYDYLAEKFGQHEDITWFVIHECEDDLIASNFMTY